MELVFVVGVSLSVIGVFWNYIGVVVCILCLIYVDNCFNWSLFEFLISWVSKLLVWVCCLMLENVVSCIVNLVFFIGFSGFWFCSCVVSIFRNVLKLLFVDVVVLMMDVEFVVEFVGVVFIEFIMLCFFKYVCWFVVWKLKWGEWRFVVG